MTSEKTSGRFDGNSFLSVHSAMGFLIKASVYFLFFLSSDKASLTKIMMWSIIFLYFG